MDHWVRWIRLRGSASYQSLQPVRSHSRLLTPHRTSSTAACRLCLARLLPAELRCVPHRGRLLLNLFSAGSAMLTSAALTPVPVTDYGGKSRLRHNNKARPGPGPEPGPSTRDKFSLRGSTVSRSAALGHPVSVSSELQKTTDVI